MKNRFIRNIDFLVVLLCGLVPLLWFEGNEILKAEDVRLPYTLDKWKALFSVWHHGWNTGSELIFDNCLMPMMLLPALLQEWGLSLLSTQKIMFVFWYTLAGFGIIYLLRTLYKGPGSLIFRLGGLSFYLFNLWLENVWIGFKPPLITAYALVPILLALSIQIFRGEIKFSLGAALYFLVSFFASGMGNNPSEFGASVAPIIIVFISFFIRGKAWKNFGLFKLLTFKTLALLCIWLCANIYWLFPQAMAIYRNAILKMGGEIATPAELIGWLKGMSIYTSFSNVIRTLGDWTWYQGCVDPYRSYSSSYAPKTFLYCLSWIVPLMALIGCWNKSISFRKTFIFLTLTGIFLSMGAHAPFGSLYIWLTENMPLFWIFRSPYLKFYFWVCLGYAVLFGAACHLIYKITSKRKAIGITLITLLCLSNLVYAFPITTGKFFHAKETRKFLSPNRFEIPDYVFKASKWLDDQPGFFRYFTLPGDNPYIYNWGGTNYGSFSNEFSSKNLAFPHHHHYTLTAQGPINQGKELLEAIRYQIYNETTPYAEELLSLFQIKYLLHEKDIRYDFYKGLGYVLGDDPKFIESKLNKQKGIKQSQLFGEWQFYETSSITPFIYAASPKNTLLLNGDTSLFTWWTFQNHPQEHEALFLNPDSSFKLAEATKIDSVFSHDNRLVVNSENLEAVIIEESPNNKKLHQKIKMDIQFLNHVPLKIEDNITWTWWDGNTDGIYFNNPTQETIFINFSFDVFSLENDRSFYVQQDGKNLRIVQLKADQITSLLVKKIELKPGKNKIHFYSPFQHSGWGGFGTSFGLNKNSFKYGTISFKVPLEQPKKESVQLKIYPPQGSASPFAWLDQNKISLKKANNSKVDHFKATLNLNDKNKQLLVEQSGKDNYFIELSRTAKASFSTKEEKTDLSHEMISSTQHQIKVKTEKPFVLIFSESYHPYWKASTIIDGENHYFNIHGKANGFANGYYIDQTGSFTVLLDFTPQKWFDLFWLLTLIGLITSLLSVLFSTIVAFKKQ